MNWFYESGGKQQGPVSEEALEQLLEKGEITLQTLVWREGMESWTPLDTVRAGKESGPEATSNSGAAEALKPGAVKCGSCGAFVEPYQVAKIGDHSVCNLCKDEVMQRIQAGGSLPTASDGERNGPPWENRENLTLIQASLETIKGVLFQPSAFFESMNRSGGLVKPLIFYVVFGSIGTILAVLYQVVFQLVTTAAGLEQEPEFTAAFGIGYTVVMLIYIVLIPIFVAIGIFIYAGITHLALMICGGANHSFETTFRVLAYASGSTALWQIVPFCGGMVAWVWGLVAGIFGLWKAHETSVGRAVLAILLPMIVCFAMAILLVIAIVIPAIAAAANQ